MSEQPNDADRELDLILANLEERLGRIETALEEKADFEAAQDYLREQRANDEAQLREIFRRARRNGDDPNFSIEPEV